MEIMSKSVKPLLTRKIHIPFEGRNIIVRKKEYGAVISLVFKFSSIERGFTILANRWGIA